jgi:hypothetical protein
LTSVAIGSFPLGAVHATQSGIAARLAERIDRG